MFKYNRVKIYHKKYSSLDLFFFFFSRDLQRIGVSLAGHQKKILTSVESMRLHSDDQSPTESV